MRPAAVIAALPLLILGLGGAAHAAEPAATDAAAAGAGGNTGALVMFWLLAIVVIGGAITTIVNRNTVTAVMALVATFFGLAGMYLMLSAQFLAALQVLVYAGAIMTLFVFVVMVLNREEAEPFVWRGWITKGFGAIAAGYLVLQAARFLFAAEEGKAEAPSPEFGGVADVGLALFTRYVFPFEALSLMLLVAVIGAVVVARAPRHHTDDHAGGLAPHPEGDDPAAGRPAAGGH